MTALVVVVWLSVAFVLSILFGDASHIQEQLFSDDPENVK